jgi:PhnB protein
MTQIFPYARFTGNCKEAMTYYQQVFGGKLEMQIVGESPMADQWPDFFQQSVLHATLVSENFTIVGGDIITDGNEHTTDSHLMVFSISCSDEQELHRLFDLLSDGGQAVKPLHKFFAGTIGVAIDRFGKEWMFYAEA